MYSSNPRRVGIYNSYTWASIHMGSIYTNTTNLETADAKKVCPICFFNIIYCHYCFPNSTCLV